MLLLNHMFVCVILFIALKASNGYATEQGLQHTKFVIGINLLASSMLFVFLVLIGIDVSRYLTN